MWLVDKASLKCHALSADTAGVENPNKITSNYARGHDRLSGCRDEGGFTLIELLVVILIIGILAAIAIPAFLSQKSKAYDSSAKTVAQTAQTAAETYATENGGELRKHQPDEAQRNRAVAEHPEPPRQATPSSRVAKGTTTTVRSHGDRDEHRRQIHGQAPGKPAPWNTSARAGQNKNAPGKVEAIDAAGQLKHGIAAVDQTPMEATFAGVLGAIVGSFLNVVVYRLPRHESLVTPASHCPRCGTPVKPYDNIPVLSWLLLRGHCRSCGAPISPRYPLVEALTAALCVGRRARARHRRRRSR